MKFTIKCVGEVGQPVPMPRFQPYQRQSLMIGHPTSDAASIRWNAWSVISSPPLVTFVWNTNATMYGTVPAGLYELNTLWLSRHKKRSATGVCPKSDEHVFHWGYVEKKKKKIAGRQLTSQAGFLAGTQKWKMVRFSKAWRLARFSLLAWQPAS